MCGIIGIIGREPVAPLLVDALKRLEYRGYDSAGVATLEHGVLTRRRAEGKLRNLEQKLVRDPLDVMRAHENGVDNVVAFLTEAVTAQQLEMLSSLMDEKRCESLTIFG